MNNAIVSFLLLVLLCTLIFSPFAALAMLMLVMFAAAIISLVSTLTHAVLGHDSSTPQTDEK